MKIKWDLKKLGEVCEFYNGKAHEKCIKENGKFKLVNSKFVSSNGEKSKRTDDAQFPLFKDDIVMVMSDVPNGKTLAKCFLIDKDNTYTLNQRVCAIRTNKFDKQFLYYQLNRNKYLLDFNNGENQTNLRKDDILNCELFVPTIPEQQHIVAILSEAFAAIAKAKANTEQNLKNSKELFDSYLQVVFENGNWETKTLNEISENLDSKRVPITKNVRNEGSIPYYGASGIVDYVADYLFDEDLLCVSEDGANLLARTYPIAFSISGRTWVNNHAHVLRFKNIESQKFVELYLNSIKLNDFVSGMAQPKLNQTMLNKIPIPFPSLKTQQTIVQKLDAISAETKKLEAIYQQKINDLEELKKSVLQKAFSGELKIKEAKEFI